MATTLAWLGGAIFVASLGYGVYFYAVVLGSAAPANAQPLWRAVVVNVLLFGIFAAHHSLFARERMKRWLTRHIPQNLERSVYVWIASALFIVVCAAWQLVPGMVYRVEGPARFALFAMQLAGVYLTLRAAGALSFRELAGIEQARRTGEPIVFRTDGPFRLVRHPIYFGWILMTFAAPTMTVNRLLFAVISSVYLILAIPWEEKSLATAFGDQYAAYRSTVRWRLIPGIW